MDFSYNKYTQFYIKRYLGKDVKLISRMLDVSSYYFPMIEQQLDKFQIPLELKYLAIVESALNPRQEVNLEQLESGNLCILQQKNMD